MQTTHHVEDLQKFIYAVEYEDFANIDSANAASQSQILDHFVKLLDFYASVYRNESVAVRFHPEFFHLPRTEEFFSQLFASLEPSLRSQIDEVFQQCWAFVVDYIGPHGALPACID